MEYGERSTPLHLRAFQDPIRIDALHSQLLFILEMMVEAALCHTQGASDILDADADVALPP
jgi:hypothetical protein